MKAISVRELRNNGAAVLSRVLDGESMQVTRDGEPVAVLSPLPRPHRSAEALLALARALPPIDSKRFRDDVDELIDQRW